MVGKTALGFFGVFIVASTQLGCDGKKPAFDAGTGTDATRSPIAQLDANTPLPSKPSEETPPSPRPNAGRPANTNENLVTRGRHLLEAIAQGNAELASDFLFPRDAYARLRDNAAATKLWERQVANAFTKQVHFLSKRMRGLERARFAGFEIGSQVAEIPARKREWKEPVWRARRARLLFNLDGKVAHIEIAELLAFQGAWYIHKLK